MIKKCIFLFITYITVNFKLIAQPNIIVFMVDDMGWQDSSVPFWNKSVPQNMQFHTPNMERLAQQGTKFTNAYATPVCTPTRVSLITGMNAARHRVTNWTSPYPDKDSSEPDSILNCPQWNYRGLSPVNGQTNMVFAKTLPQILSDNNYYTIHVGKAHFGAQNSPGELPENLGFKINIAGNMTGHPQSFLGEKNYGNMDGKATIHAVKNLEKYHNTETFLTEALTLEAINELEKVTSTGKPFFLHLSHYAVHLPFDADLRYFEKYLQKGLTPSEAAYSALIEGMDKSLGDVMEYLVNKKIDHNTIIIFMSDNGGFSYKPARMGEAFTQNYPLFMGKGSVHEGGIRVPVILKWPGKTIPNSISTYPIVVEDWFSTILKMAHIKTSTTPQTIDGEDISPKLYKSKNKDKKMLWHYPNKWGISGPGISFHSAMIKGDYKIIYDQKLEKVKMYNLKTDISEKNDLALKNKAKTKKLTEEMSELLKQRYAQMPFNKIKNREVLWPNEAIKNQFQ